MSLSQITQKTSVQIGLVVAVCLGAYQAGGMASELKQRIGVVERDREQDRQAIARLSEIVNELKDLNRASQQRIE